MRKSSSSSFYYPAGWNVSVAHQERHVKKKDCRIWVVHRMVKGERGLRLVDMTDTNCKRFLKIDLLYQS